VPIIAGIMPVTSSKTASCAMAEVRPGSTLSRPPAEVHRTLRRRRKYVRKVGVHWTTEQCRDLLDNQVRAIPLLHAQSLDCHTGYLCPTSAVKDSRGLIKNSGKQDEHNFRRRRVLKRASLGVESIERRCIYESNSLHGKV